MKNRVRRSFLQILRKLLSGISYGVIMKSISVLVASTVFTVSLAVPFPVNAQQLTEEKITPNNTECPVSTLVNCQENLNLDPDPIVVNGKKFTKEDGLVEYEVSGEITEGDVAEPAGSMQPTGWKPYYKTQVNWGASWVKNKEIFYLKYRGTTQAAGNVYRGKRIIQTQIKYVRNSKLLSRAISNAVYRGNSWRPGKIGTASAWDSVKSKAPVTHFYYKYYSVNPGLVG